MSDKIEAKCGPSEINAFEHVCIRVRSRKKKLNKKLEEVEVLIRELADDTYDKKVNIMVA